MSTFNATIDLGNIGSSLLNFSFSGCTGYNPAITGTTPQKLKNCNYLTGCTALTSYDNTPKSSLVGGTSITLTGLTYNPSSSQMNWIHVKAVNVANGNAETAIECADSNLCQNIQISGIPTFTPTPAPTSTPTPTPTPTSVTPATSTPTPTPTPTNTNTPTPTSETNVIGSGYFGLSPEAACGDPSTRISVNFTGNTNTFCSSIYFTGNTFAYQTTGTYKLGYDGNYLTINITFGSNVAEVTSFGCTTCPGVATPTPTSSIPATDTPTPTPTGYYEFTIYKGNAGASGSGTACDDALNTIPGNTFQVWTATGNLVDAGTVFTDSLGTNPFAGGPGAGFYYSDGITYGRINNSGYYTQDGTCG